MSGEANASLPTDCRRSAVGRDPVRAAPVAGEEMLRAFDLDVVAERGTEQLELGTAEILARRSPRRRSGSGARRAPGRRRRPRRPRRDSPRRYGCGRALRRGRAATRRLGIALRYAASCVLGARVDHRRRARRRRARARIASSRSTVRSSWWSGKRSRARSVSAHTSPAGRARPAVASAAATRPLAASASRCWRTAASVKPERGRELARRRRRRA